MEQEKIEPPQKKTPVTTTTTQTNSQNKENVKPGNVTVNRGIKRKRID